MMMIGIFPLFLFLLFLFSASLEVLVRRAHPERHAAAGLRGARLRPADHPADQEVQSRQRDWEVGVFRLAARYGGRLTLSDVVIGTGRSLQEAERLMDRLVDGSHVRMELSEEGRVVYEFPEIISRA